MLRSELELLLDLILNKSDFKDIEVIKKALDRRMSDLNRVGGFNLDLRSLSKKMAGDIQEQIGGTRETIQTMARELVEKLIRQKAPEIPEEHLQALLAEWVPTDAEKAQRGPPPKQSSGIPKDVLVVMIRDFVTYSSGSMSASRQIAMKDELGDWPNLYWSRFPDRIQKLIRLYLEGKLPLDPFWAEIEASLEEA